MPVDVALEGAALSAALEAAVREYFERCFTQRKFEDLGAHLVDSYRAYLPGGKVVSGIDEGGPLRTVLTSITEKFAAAGAALPTVAAATYHAVSDDEVARAEACDAWGAGAPPSARPWLCKALITLSNGDAHPKLWLFCPLSGKLAAAWPADVPPATS